LFGHAPAAPRAFVVKAFFEHIDKSGDASETSSRVELLCVSSSAFADVSMAMITAYGDVTRVGRDLLLESSDGQSRARSFYGAVFKGLDADGSGTIDYRELKDGLARMELRVSAGELEAHFFASGTDELDSASVTRLLKRYMCTRLPFSDCPAMTCLFGSCRHLKIKLGEILEAVYDPDAFALWLRDDLESSRGLTGNQTAEACHDSLAGLLPARSAEDTVAALTAAVAAAAAEVSLLAAKRASVRARLAALAGGHVASSAARGASAEASGRSGGDPAVQLHASTMAKHAAALADDGGARVGVSMAPVDGSTGGALLEGWLKRKAGSVPYSYQKQYLVLKAGALLLFDKPGGPLKEHLDLNAGLVLSPNDGLHRFSLTAAVRKEVHFEAPSAEQQDKWLDQLMAESGRQLRRRNLAGKLENSS
jgi:hypothetical protein